ncbi:MAG: hypothetical protein ACRDRL_03925 [Sciscionella sp.]
MFQHHGTTRLIPPGASNPVDIDNDMVPLVQQLWAMGLTTMACCQDNGQAVEAERGENRKTEPTGHHGFIEYHRGWAWLKMPVPDTLALLSVLSEHEVFASRTQVRWQRGSWRIHIPVIHDNTEFRPAPYAQIYFPRTQITELTTALKAPT